MTQDSVLGPTLYLLYTYDLPEVDTIKTATFEDDTLIYKTCKMPLTTLAVEPKGGE